MFGKVKKWLGIEGVKLELLLPDSTSLRSKKVQGTIRLMSLEPHTVVGLSVRMYEKYKRGWRKEKLIDEYKIGEINKEHVIQVPAKEEVDIDFTIPFEISASGIDKFGSRNFVFGSLAKIAKTTYAVKSTYYLVAEAKVKGVGLHPFDKKFIKLK